MNYLLDSHTHTIASGHAYNTIYEMAHSAADKGLSLLGITEHAMAMPGTCHELYFMNLKVVPRTLCGIEVLFGAEANIIDLDGGLDMKEKVLQRMDVVVASLHTVCIEPGSCERNTNAYLKAMENPFVNIIGHPDDGRFPVDYDTVAAAAKEQHVLLELNNSSLDPRGARMNALENDRKLLQCCMKYGTSIILDSDAHCAADVGRHDYSGRLIEEMQFPEELIVNRSVEIYKSYLKRYEK
ncbi:MAG: phosphatase [Lachnospiraceae bacterium]|nr:phosphatase [Lachnospiraceae bacterium]